MTLATRLRGHTITLTAFSSAHGKKPCDSTVSDAFRIFDGSPADAWATRVRAAIETANRGVQSRVARTNPGFDLRASAHVCARTTVRAHPGRRHGVTGVFPRVLPAGAAEGARCYTDAVVMLTGLRDKLRFDASFWRKLAWYGAARGPSWWLRYSPPAIGVVFAVALPDKRRLVRDNLRSILGPRPLLREQVDVARTFVAFASSLADGMALSERDRYAPTVDVTGGDHLDRAAADGSGVILATAHTAGWETAVTALRRGYADRKVLVVMHREADGEAGAMHDAWRRELGFEIVHAGEDPLSLLPLLRHLREGGFVAVQLDRSPAGIRGRSVPVHGRTLQTPEGPFQLAALTGCPIVPVFARRTGFLRYELSLRPAIRVPKHPDESALERATREAASALADFVGAHPTQWFHFV